MAVSCVAVHRGETGAVPTLRFSVTDVTFDNSYPTGGEAVTASDLGLSTVAWAQCTLLVPGGTATACAQYDKTNAKILVYNTTAQVSAATDLSALVVRVTAYGT